jgi:hypothetical protein
VPVALGLGEGAVDVEDDGPQRRCAHLAASVRW